jgi:hypothetical protein
VKKLLHDAGIPPWQRGSLPFVYCGDALAAVPGIGIDAAFRAAGDAPELSCIGIPVARDTAYATASKFSQIPFRLRQSRSGRR